MKSFGILAACALAATSSIAFGQSHAVRGYFKSNGTYVEPHMQTNPNQTRMDNWSSRPNINPYTGKEGTQDPYATPAPRLPDPYKSPYDPD